MRSIGGLNKSILITFILTAILQTPLCFAAGNLLNDFGFEQSEPNGGFPDSGSWQGAWLGAAGAGSTTTAARSGDNGLWQYTGFASADWFSYTYQDVPSWPNRIYFASAWVRTDFEDSFWVPYSRVFIKVLFLDESKVTLAEYRSRDINSISDQWTLLYFATHPAPSRTRFVRFQLCVEKPQDVGLTVINFDDCILRQIECEDCVRFDEIPSCGSSDKLKGTVVGVNPNDYKLGVYLFNDGWWPKPSFSNAWTDINSSDGTWQCDIITSVYDLDATEILAFLVPKSEIAEWPVDLDEHVGLSALPGEAFRFPSAGSFRPACFPDSLLFAGREWLVKDSGSGTLDPGSNHFDPNNVWVDSDGLHLKISNVDGQWRCAEVFSEDIISDGLFTFKIKTDVSSLDRNVVLGMFTWDEFAPHYANREMDIEVSQWGNPDNDNAQFVIQPWDALGNTHRFNIDPCDAGTTHILDWSSDGAAFASFYGQYVDQNQLIDSWDFTGNAVPNPGKQNIRLNLWLRDGIAPADFNEVEVIINDFNYIPCTYDLQTNNLDFDSVLISKSATKTVKISNGGRCSPYFVVVSVTGPDADYFLAADRAFEMEPGSSKEIEVTFMPEENRTYNASLIIAGDAQTETVPLTGTGVRLGYTRVPTIAGTDFLQGIAKGIRSSDYRVISYVFTDKWYIKPLENSSAKRLIGIDGSWKCDIDNLPSDDYVTRVASFLVPKNDDMLPATLDSLDDSRVNIYDGIWADKPKLAIKKVTAKAGSLANDSITIEGTYFVDMLELLYADSLCIDISQEDSSLWQLCVPFDFIKFIKNNGFVYEQGGVLITFENTKRVDESFAGTFKLQISRADLMGLKNPLTLNFLIGDFNQTAVADESIDSSIINGLQSVPILFLSGFTDSLRVDKLIITPGKKNNGSLNVKGAIVFQDSIPDLIEQDVTLSFAGKTFTIPAGSFKKGDAGLKYRCVNSPVVQGGVANATFDFINSSFSVKISKVNLDQASGTVAFNLAMGAFSEGVSVDTDR